MTVLTDSKPCVQEMDKRCRRKLKKSSFVKSQEDVQLVKLASLSPLHVLTPVSGFQVYRLANCGLCGTSSPTNSCHCLILNLYSPNMICVPLTMHAFSEKSKNPRGLVLNAPPLQVGAPVYLVSAKNKSRARDRYIVVSTDPPRCFVKKFSGS